MPTRIPLPGQGGEALQKGVESGTNLWQQLLGQGLQQQQMQQQMQEHLRNAAIREAQEARLREQNPLNLDALKAKIDLLKAQTEKAKRSPEPKESAEEKSARRIEERKAIEDYKAEKKGKEDYTKPTKTVISQQQNIVAAGNNLRKQLKHLKNIKSPNVVGWISPGEKATYETEANKAADTLMATYKWLGIQSSLDMAKQMTTRQIGETDDQYAKRLDDLDAEAESRIMNAEEILKSNKIESHKFDKKNEHKESPQEVSERNKANMAKKVVRKRWNSKTEKMEEI